MNSNFVAQIYIGLKWRNQDYIVERLGYDKIEKISKGRSTTVEFVNKKTRFRARVCLSRELLEMIKK